MKFLAVLLLVCIILGVAALVRTLMIPVRKSDYKPPEGDPRAPAYAEKLSRMVKYDTTSYAGAEQRETFLGYHKILEELFPLVHRHLDKTEINGSLLYHWKGKEDKYPVVLMGHQDVVPVSGEWSKPPFSGEISEGRVWGRGSVDTKCSCMAFFSGRRRTAGGRICAGPRRLALHFLHRGVGRTGLSRAGRRTAKARRQALACMR